MSPLLAALLVDCADDIAETAGRSRHIQSRPHQQIVSRDLGLVELHAAGYRRAVPVLDDEYSAIRLVRYCVTSKAQAQRQYGQTHPNPASHRYHSLPLAALRRVTRV